MGSFIRTINTQLRPVGSQHGRLDNASASHDSDSQETTQLTQTETHIMHIDLQAKKIV
ncbi:hypothetical protein GBAR_LOCUS16990 [Geodia barretti]|uniref:Uncharacterized protein n=1 Tax=Geodia barretti TaxID=519541 RepID=A0AA35WQC3_GEOBA|nr:hypothetical protein GBAR_LOCUS16990 [Geodia barretti]